MRQSFKTSSALSELAERRIYVIRGVKVMMDSDLAALYGVPTKRLNEATKRNIARFPADFMFRLTKEEAALLRSQIATSSKRSIKYQPFAFTEHGVAMLSSVLGSKRAIEVNILIIRAFIRLREMAAMNKDFAARLEKLENSHHRTVSVIEVLVDEIDSIPHEVRRMRTLPIPAKRKIGFDLK